MKKSVKIGINLVILALIIVAYIFFRISSYNEEELPINNSQDKEIVIDCAQAGDVSTNPSLSPQSRQDKQCCPGLVEISGGFVFNPEDERADENGCSLVGAGLVCSNCGDSICDSWENRCNCPVDCLSQ